MNWHTVLHKEAKKRWNMICKTNLYFLYIKTSFSRVMAKRPPGTQGKMEGVGQRAAKYLSTILWKWFKCGQTLTLAEELAHSAAVMAEVADFFENFSFGS